MSGKKAHHYNHLACFVAHILFFKEYKGTHNVNSFESANTKWMNIMHATKLTRTANRAQLFCLARRLTSLLTTVKINEMIYIGFQHHKKSKLVSESFYTYLQYYLPELAWWNVTKSAKKTKIPGNKIWDSITWPKMSNFTLIGNVLEDMINLVSTDITAQQ